MSKIVFIPFFILLFAPQTFTAPQRDEIDCKKVQTTIDKLGREIFLYGDRDHTFPYTLEEVEDKHCKRLRAAIKSIRSYTQKCLKPFPRQVIGLIIHGSAKTLRKRCKSEASIFVGHAKCIENKNVEPAHRCMDKYIAKLEAVRDNVNNSDHKIPYTCCLFYEFKACVVKESNKVCNSKESVDYMKKTAEEVSEEALQLTCRGYEEKSGNCAKLPKIETRKSQVALSIITPLADIYTNI